MMSWLTAVLMVLLAGAAWLAGLRHGTRAQPRASAAQDRSSVDCADGRGSCRAGPGSGGGDSGGSSGNSRSSNGSCSDSGSGSKHASTAGAKPWVHRAFSHRTCASAAAAAPQRGAAVHERPYGALPRASTLDITPQRGSLAPASAPQHAVAEPPDFEPPALTSISEPFGSTQHGGDREQEAQQQQAQQQQAQQQQAQQQQAQQQQAQQPGQLNLASVLRHLSGAATARAPPAVLPAPGARAPGSTSGPGALGFDGRSRPSALYNSPMTHITVSLKVPVPFEPGAAEALQHGVARHVRAAAASSAGSAAQHQVLHFVTISGCIQLLLSVLQWRDEHEPAPEQQGASTSQPQQTAWQQQGSSSGPPEPGEEQQPALQPGPGGDAAAALGSSHSSHSSVLPGGVLTETTAIGRRVAAASDTPQWLLDALCSAVAEFMQGPHAAAAAAAVAAAGPGGERSAGAAAGVRQEAAAGAAGAQSQAQPWQAPVLLHINGTLLHMLPNPHDAAAPWSLAAPNWPAAPAAPVTGTAATAAPAAAPGASADAGAPAGAGAAAGGSTPPAQPRAVEAHIEAAGSTPAPAAGTGTSSGNTGASGAAWTARAPATSSGEGSAPQHGASGSTAQGTAAGVLAAPHAGVPPAQTTWAVSTSSGLPGELWAWPLCLRTVEGSEAGSSGGGSDCSATGRAVAGSSRPSSSGSMGSAGPACSTGFGFGQAGSPAAAGPTAGATAGPTAGAGAHAAPLQRLAIHGLPGSSCRLVVADAGGGVLLDQWCTVQNGVARIEPPGSSSIKSARVFCLSPGAAAAAAAAAPAPAADRLLCVLPLLWLPGDICSELCEGARALLLERARTRLVAELVAGAGAGSASAEGSLRSSSTSNGSSSCASMSLPGPSGVAAGLLVSASQSSGCSLGDAGLEASRHVGSFSAGLPRRQPGQQRAASSVPAAGGLLSGGSGARPAAPRPPLQRSGHASSSASNASNVCSAGSSMSSVSRAAAPPAVTGLEAELDPQRLNLRGRLFEGSDVHHLLADLGVLSLLQDLALLIELADAARAAPAPASLAAALGEQLLRCFGRIGCFATAQLVAQLLCDAGVALHVHGAAVTRESLASPAAVQALLSGAAAQPAPAARSGATPAAPVGAASAQPAPATGAGQQAQAQWAPPSAAASGGAGAPREQPAAEPLPTSAGAPAAEPLGQGLPASAGAPAAAPQAAAEQQAAPAAHRGRRAGRRGSSGRRGILDSASDLWRALRGKAERAERQAAAARSSGSGSVSSSSGASVTGAGAAAARVPPHG